MLHFDKNHIDFNGISFCIRALNKNANRDFKKKLYYDGEFFVGTDSGRLHVYRPENDYVSKGFYVVIKSIKNSIQIEHDADVFFTDDIYPDYKDIICKLRSEQSDFIYTYALDDLDDKALSLTYTEIDRLRSVLKKDSKRTLFLSINKLRDILSLNEVLGIKVFAYDEGVYFNQGDKYQAVLMPIIG